MTPLGANVFVLLLALVVFTALFFMSVGVGLCLIGAWAFAALAILKRYDPID